MAAGALGRALVYLPLLAAAAFYALPVYLLLITGLKSYAEAGLDRMWHLPSTVSLDSFRQAYRQLQPHVLNSVALTVPASVISSFVGSLNGFVLAKGRLRGSDLIFPLLLFGMFIPYQSILIPLVRTLQRVNALAEAVGVPPGLSGLVPGYGSIAGLAFVHIVYGIPITTLIFRNYYATIPDELVDAARVDGAGLLGIYGRVLLPLSLPAFAVVLIWQFTSIWNEFLFAVVLTQKPAVRPVTVALYNLAGSYIVEWNVQMAGALLAALPTLLVYILLGRYFLRGLLAGALRG
ncbi:MAG: carbohydrate ABC transporter permease [Armatimonadota bacterium]|nr:carbohydrate ABC transporter permease [Armatimonadota bacterium]MDR7402301.1 carbohydrate ABC transporter permease [Armatimonadota bacterium]MDR7403820.1 carbohydrate ABC transporter permease [Armatimonadota bacterium]MDR7437611.1 carbohydrate ABC transporter permease [Armatimonadota bacterium]MDR7472625.1 carbohydrate ABC transporter permease [Armatimonadota bacterium]